MKKQPREGSSIIFGLLLVAGGAIWLLDQLGILAVGPRVLAAGLLVALGLGLIGTSRTVGRRRHRGLIVLGVALVVGLAASSSTHVSVADGVGERTVTPIDSTELAKAQSKGRFDLSLGELIIDLSQIQDFGVERLKANVRIGEIRIIVPEGVSVELRVHGGPGDLTLFGEKSARGGDIFLSTDGSSTGSRLKLDLDIGVGNISVVRAASKVEA
ncbi:MAG: LiaF domain-containing protein [Actinomycetota bacterium]